MKKLLISALFTISFVGYAFYNSLSAQAGSVLDTALNTTVMPATSGLGAFTAPAVTPVSAPHTVVSTPSAPSTPTKTPTKTPTPTPVVTQPVPTPVTKPKGQYTDGTYNGSVADAYYGNVQVQAVISGGRLINIGFLQYPSDRSTSLYISQQALPLLKSEAIQAQSANVDGISGASHTSQGFVESLSSALSQAKA